MIPPAAAAYSPFCSGTPAMSAYPRFFGTTRAVTAIPASNRPAASDAHSRAATATIGITRARPRCFRSWAAMPRASRFHTRTLRSMRSSRSCRVHRCLRSWRCDSQATSPHRRSAQPVPPSESRRARRTSRQRRGTGLNGRPSTRRLGLDLVELVLGDRSRVEQLLGLGDLGRGPSGRLAHVLVELLLLRPACRTQRSRIPSCWAIR